jgi:hypothetical protein
MSVELLWTLDRGFGHIVAGRRDHYLMTLCDIFGNFPEPTPERPKRICRRCRSLHAQEVARRTHDR